VNEATAVWPRQVVVGVDGRPAGTAALTWAAAEAYARGMPLTVYHCWQPLPRTPTARLIPPFATSGSEVNLSARIVLDDALEHVGSVAPGLTVHGELLQGRAGPVLADNVDPADLLVVGRHGTHRLAARLLASTTSHLLAHTQCAVIVVPTSAPVSHGPFGGHVVVGVDNSTPSEEALRMGFAESAAHGWPLAAVHVANASATNSAIDETTLEVTLIPFPSQYRLLQAAIEPWRHRYPDVAVRRACFTGSVAHALLRATAGARLLVIGRHERRPLERRPSRLVGVLLARTSSPVALTAPVHTASPGTAPWPADDHEPSSVR
jgi:nucleotide-binding universal stress UspA family protein